MCYGALILGHGHSAIKQAIEDAFQTYGTSAFGTPIQLESDYGRMLLDLYNREGLIRFTNSGMEATLLAVRLAKAHNGKSKIGKFEGHYHGSNDHLLISYRPHISEAGDGVRPRNVPDSADIDAETLSKTVTLPFNEWEATEKLIVENSDELACVILEPFEDGYIQGDRSFISSLRKLTADLKIPLIFDEVKTGFRIRIGGASEYYSVTPDITCLGKIIGGGFPIGAVVGRKEIMSALDPSASTRKSVFHSGTFNGNPISLSAGKATVETLQKDGGFQQIVDVTKSLKAGFDRRLGDAGLKHQMLGEGALFSVVFAQDQVRSYRDLERSNRQFRRLLDFMLMLRGVYVKPMERFSLSLAHTREDISRTVEKLDAVLNELKNLPNAV
jgi:glutamate-1-semialdehyde 2,1-aminomutase